MSNNTGQMTGKSISILALFGLPISSINAANLGLPHLLGKV
jgi:hypothetical protein